MEYERFVKVFFLNYKNTILYVQKNQTKVLLCFKYLRALSKSHFLMMGCEFSPFARL